MMKNKNKAVASPVDDESDAIDDEDTFDSVDSATASSAATTCSATSAIVLATNSNTEASTKRSRTVESKSLSKRNRVQ